MAGFADAAPMIPPGGVDATAEPTTDRSILHERVREMLDRFADRTGLEHFRSTGVWTVGVDPPRVARQSKPRARCAGQILAVLAQLHEAQRAPRAPRKPSDAYLELFALIHREAS